jgi:hypothetical protein
MRYRGLVAGVEKDGQMAERTANFDRWPCGAFLYFLTR